MTFSILFMFFFLTGSQVLGFRSELHDEGTWEFCVQIAFFYVYEMSFYFMLELFDIETGKLMFTPKSFTFK